MTDRITKLKVLSVVIPIHNEQDNIKWHYHKITTFFSKIDQKYEIIYVDDGSTDKSIELIKDIAKHDSSNIRYISLSRNFGKESATTAGLRMAKGDASVIMDGDGQHPVELVEKFIKLWGQGYDVVIGLRKSNSNEGFVKKYGSYFFYKILRIIGGNEVVEGSTDYRLIDKKVVDEFNKLTERNRVTRNLIDWLGYSRIEVPFDAEARHSGKASYSARKLFKLAVSGIISHSTRPLKIIALLGSIISLLSALAGILFGIQKYVLGDPMGLSITGSALLALFVTFMVGIVLVCQGLLALYLESVYYESQNRPLYVIKESN
jgi:glycosyltransferase involved in cell wall biosynthesis